MSPSLRPACRLAASATVTDRPEARHGGAAWLPGALRYLLRCLLLAAPLSHAAPDAQQYGRAYLAEGEHQAATQSFNEALKINPFDPVLLNNLAVARAAQGDYQSALDLLQRAVRLAPRRSDIASNLRQLQGWLEAYGRPMNADPSGVSGSRLPAPSRPLLATAPLLPEPPPLWPPAQTGQNRR